MTAPASRPCSTFFPARCCARRAARRVTTENEISDARFAGPQATLGNDLMLDRTTAIAFYGAVVFVLATLRIDVQDDSMPYLRRFPLPIG